MKKLFILLAAMAFGLLSLAGPASATGGGGIPSPDNNKKVTLCHATGSASNPYVKITVSVNAFYMAGHIDHQNHGDIYEGFSWTDKRGNVHTVPAQGDTSLLAFDDCVKPVVKEKVAKPSETFVDKCGTADDVFAVAPGRGYTVSPLAYEGNNMVITVTLDEGFTWLDGSTQTLRFVHGPFDTEPCDLPETGGAAYATTAGIGAIAGAAVLGLYLLFGGRRRTQA